VILLAQSFAAQLGKELRGRPADLSSAAVDALRAHSWPGNVRELENAIERACILSDTLTLEPVDLGLIPPAFNTSEALASIDLSGSLADVTQRAVSLVERRKIQSVLAANNGNKSQTAEELGISYKTLLTKLKEYEL